MRTPSSSTAGISTSRRRLRALGFTYYGIGRGYRPQPFAGNIDEELYLVERSARRDRSWRAVAPMASVIEAPDAPMLDSVMLWNEPNNVSHWDSEIRIPDWSQFARMVRWAMRGDRRRTPAR